MNSVHSTLLAVRELIAVPERWVKGDWARSASGRDVFWGSEKAVCWCIRGAVNLVEQYSPSNSYRAQEKLALMATGKSELMALAEWNDAPQRTHADVLALLDRALEETKPR